MVLVLAGAEVRAVARAWIGAALLLAAAAVAACSGPSGAAAEGPAPGARLAAAPPAPEALTATVGETLEVVHAVPTRLMTESEVIISARSSGVLEQVRVERGDPVRAGQVLASFESEMQRLQAEAAEAEQARAEAEEERLRVMWESSLVSAQEYELARRDRDVARADRDLARHLLARTEVLAPFDGVITERFARAGMYVLEADVVPLFRILGSGPLQARVFLPEWTASYLRTGASTEVVPEFGGGAPLPGRIQWISPVVDAIAGTLEVRVQIGTQASAAAGAAVSVRLRLRSDPAHPLVPRASLSEPDVASGASATLYVAVPDGRWEGRQIRLGLVGPESAEVQSGLAAGERYRASAHE